MRTLAAGLLVCASVCAGVCACGGPTRGRDPDIFVQPQAAVVFGRVIVGESARVPVVVRNVGDGALTVSSVGLASPGSFSLDMLATPVTLDPGQAFSFDVIYAPAADATDDDLLTITSNDPDEDVVVLPVTAGQRGPHLRFDPPIIDWGLLADRWAAVDATLVNDGTEPVMVDAVTLDSGAEWVLDAGGAAGQTLAPGDTVSVTVTRDVAFQDTLTLGIGRVTASPAMPGIPEAHLELRGPPMAVVGPDVDTVPLEVAMLDGTPSFAPGGAISEVHWHVAQSPAGSRTAGQFEAGDAQTVRDVERCPAGQNVLPQPCFFPDAPGTYQFELRVVDVRPSCALAAAGTSCSTADECCSFDCPAAGTCAAAVEPEDVCGPAGACAISSTNVIGSVQVVRAIPDQAVFVSLVWDGPGDLDLHMVRDSASAAKAWTSVPDDTYWNNPQPDWGVLDPTNNAVCMGSADCTVSPYTFCRRPAAAPTGICVDATDDPRLLIDVTSSFGPEAIGMKVPPADVYHVGVHYFPDENMSARRATLRFFVLGEERFAPGTGPGAPMSLILGRNDFWYAARVIVPPAVDDATIEAVPIAPGNPQSNADPGSYPAIP